MTHIIHPYREVEMGCKARITGHVNIKKIDRSGNVTFNSKFDNLVLDEFLYNGLYGAYTGSNTNDYGVAGMSLGVGTGVQTAPLPSDTTLGNFLDMAHLGSPGGGQYFSDDHVDISGESGQAQLILGATPFDDYRSIPMSATFDYSQAVGNLTELGVFLNRYNSTPGTSHYLANPGEYSLLTKTLIKDGSGNPIVVTKSSAEKLIVDYELRQYRCNEPVATFNLNGQDIKLFLPSMARENVSDGRDLLDMSLSANTQHRSSNDRHNSLPANLSGGPISTVEKSKMIFGMYKSNCATSSAIRSDLYGNIGDLSNFLFTGANQVDPDTQDRVINCVGHMNYYQDLIWMRPDNDPYKIGASKSANFYPAFFSFIDPVTNAAKDFTLPAGYRLDLGVTFERTR